MTYNHSCSKKALDHKGICHDCGASFVGHFNRKFCDDCPPASARNYANPGVERAPMRTTCIQCGDSIKPYANRKYCSPCGSTMKYPRIISGPKNDNEMARRITTFAVRVGFLPLPTDFPCVDCGKPAKCYEHRDYSKPLDVVPVCIHCNKVRGRGIPVKFPCYEYVCRDSA